MGVISHAKAWMTPQQFRIIRLRPGRYQILRLRSLRTAHFVARGCRPFYAKEEPLALPPGATNPRMTLYAETEK